MWQQSGSDCDMGLHSAKDQIDDLNRAGFAGHSDWRLPTLEEAMSLVEPEKNDAGLHIDSLFDTKQDQIWTCDSAADVGFRDSSLGFYVSFKHGRYSVGGVWAILEPDFMADHVGRSTEELFDAAEEGDSFVRGVRSEVADIEDDAATDTNQQVRTDDDELPF